MAGDAAGTTWPALGTSAQVFVTDPAALGEARAIVEAELDAVDVACSRFRADSELSLLNARNGRQMSVSPLFAAALEVALRAAAVTDGDVDPTVGQALIAIGYDRDLPAVLADRSPLRVVLRPSPGWRVVELDRESLKVRLPPGVVLDLGATAKALCADRAAAGASGRCDCGVLVSLGGDVAVAGPAPDDGWSIRVIDDHRAKSGAGGQTVAIHGGGLATSSTTVRAWRRGDRDLHHIVAPRTGDAVMPYWRTASVAAGTCLDANIASTAAIVRGEAAIDWLEERRLPSRLMRIDGAVVRTAGWPDPDRLSRSGKPAMASSRRWRG